MALYGQQAYRGSAAGRRQSGCESCGRLPSEQTRAHRVNSVTIAVARHATNRVLVQEYYARKAGRPDLAGRRICNACWENLISRPMNRTS